MLLKLVIGFVLIAHGIGHVLGWFPIFGWSRAAGWTGDSWLLDGIGGPTLAHAVGFVLWGVAMVGFACSGSRSPSPGCDRWP
jgi:hypothetical protein